MKKLIVLLFILCNQHAQAAIAVMPRIKAELFCPGMKEDLETIYWKDADKLRDAVKWLFDNNLLEHDYTKAYLENADFNTYYGFFEDRWHLIDLDNDDRPELVFSGLTVSGDEKESFYLYVQYGEVWKEVIWEQGHLMGYQIHPNTEEILLYHHRYPCCSQSSHTITRFRWIRGKLKKTQKYFLARDSAMLGNFFPEKSNFTNRYKRLNKKKMLYWSSEFIREKAYLMSPTNEIIHYQKDSYYRLLAKRGSWSYVMMISPPIQEQSRVVNAQNLRGVAVFGWMYKL